MRHLHFHEKITNLLTKLKKELYFKMCPRKTEEEAIAFISSQNKKLRKFFEKDSRYRVRFFTQVGSRSATKEIGFGWPSETKIASVMNKILILAVETAETSGRNSPQTGTWLRFRCRLRPIAWEID